ncbi:hypothetical protein [Brachybacterium sp. AOP24-D1-21]|uniref:hypothetical protein n=1 Tax=Brachybacterium sp. AOP24-D1-21 TaxID=3457711 RepID=UPI0040332163
MPLDYAIHWMPEWISWNEAEWGLKATQLSFESNNLKLSAVAYTNRKGRAVMPPLNFYLPVKLERKYGNSSKVLTEKALSEEWFTTAGAYAAWLKDAGTSGTLALPPGFNDVRPFQWAGFDCTPRYTYTTALPVEEQSISKSLRKSIERAKRTGHTLKAGAKIDDVYRLLEETSRAQGFRLAVSSEGLHRLDEALGSNVLHSQSVIDSDGNHVSAGIRLSSIGGTGLGWLQGTHRESLKHGVAQLMQLGALTSLSQSGSSNYDYIGANVPSVALAKSAWGMELSTYFQFSSSSLRSDAIAATKGIVRPAYMALLNRTKRTALRK